MFPFPLHPLKQQAQVSRRKNLLPRSTILSNAKVEEKQKKELHRKKKKSSLVYIIHTWNSLTLPPKKRLRHRHAPIPTHLSKEKKTCNRKEEQKKMYS